ncbi:MAG: hypothetical protein KAW92_01480 [Candidatus Cloacimonetes bacterium]|nr:hypothetical protein [Candidatus Cloacimonadota bacterium]
MINGLKDIVTWANTNAGILSIIVAILLVIIPFIWSFFRYLNLKNRELKFECFKVYHQLIKDLVQPEAEGKSMMLDRQIAIVFELRNFPNYYELTLRTLQGLKRGWSTGSTERNRLLDEMALTIKHIKKKFKKTQQEDELDS